MTSRPDRAKIAALAGLMAEADFDAGETAAARPLEEHLAAHPEQSSLYRAMVQMWDELGELEEPELANIGLAELTQEPCERWWRRVPYHEVAAALIPCLMFAGLFLILDPFRGAPPAEAPLELRTAAAERRIVTLPDGSRVTMSARTHLIVDLGSEARRLTLSRGEALFEVIHDPLRPFIVSAAGGEVTAVGTAFNIRVERDGAIVTVLEGRVSVAPSASPGGSRGRALRQLAAAGQQISYRSGAVARLPSATQSIITSPRPVDAPRSVDWSRGVLQFDGEPLSEVVEEVNRHSARQIRVLDPELARTPIYGVLHIGDERGLISIIRDLDGLSEAALRQKIHIEEPEEQER